MDDTEKFDDKKFTEALQGEDAASAGRGGMVPQAAAKGRLKEAALPAGTGKANMRISAISATGRKARLAR